MYNPLLLVLAAKPSFSTRLSNFYIDYINLQILTNGNLPWKTHFKSGMEALMLIQFKISNYRLRQLI